MLCSFTINVHDGIPFTVDIMVFFLSCGRKHTKAILQFQVKLFVDDGGPAPLLVENEVLNLVDCCATRGPPCKLTNVPVWEDCTTNYTVV